MSPLFIPATLTQEQINHARIFMFLEQDFFKINCPLTPYFKFMQNFFENNYENQFWEDCIDLIDNYRDDSDHFQKMLKKQIDLKNTHTLDFESDLIKDII